MCRDMIESVLKTIPFFSGTSICDFKVEKLAGLTNNNYLLTLVGAKGKKYILRIPKDRTNQFINRSNEAHNAEVVYKLGIAPKCLWRGEGEQEGMSLSEYVNGAEYANVHSENIVIYIAEILVKLHQSDIKFNGILDNQNIAFKLTQYFDACPSDRQQVLVSDYQKSLLLLAEPLDVRPKVPSHVDLIRENILQQNEKIWLIDWEYSAMASPFWDVAVLCNSVGFDAEQSKKLLEKILSDYQAADILILYKFRVITKTMSACWGYAST